MPRCLSALFVLQLTSLLCHAVPILSHYVGFIQVDSHPVLLLLQLALCKHRACMPALDMYGLSCRWSVASACHAQCRFDWSMVVAVDYAQICLRACCVQAVLHRHIKQRLIRAWQDVYSASVVKHFQSVRARSLYSARVSLRVLLCWSTFVQRQRRRNAIMSAALKLNRSDWLCSVGWSCTASLAFHTTLCFSNKLRCTSACTRHL